MKKSVFTVSIVLVLLVSLSNFTFVGALLGKPIIHAYHYESHDGKFKETEVPEKGRNFDFVLSRFEKYKIESGQLNIELYRTFKRNPIEFYSWYDFATNKRWKLKYKGTNQNT